MVLDGPAFFYLFWGAIKAGIVPVPVNTLLRAADYAYLIGNSGCAAVVYSPELAAEVEPALDLAPHRPDVALRTSELPAADGAGGCGAGAGGGTGGGRLLLAVFVGFDRAAEGCGAQPSHHGGDQPALRRGHARRARGRRVLFGGEAVLLLRPRQRHDLSAVDRRHGGADAGPSDAGKHLRRDRAVPANSVLRRSDLVCPADRRTAAASCRSVVGALLRFGRRGAAGAISSKPGGG